MNVQEREFALRELASSEADLLELVAGLGMAQWHFHEAPERWSIAENFEHLILFEGFILGRIEAQIEAGGNTEAESRFDVSAKEALVLGLAQARATRFTAREVVRPIGGWSDPVELIAELQAARATTMTFARETAAPLRDRFFAHIAFGDLDCYQWLLVLSQHTERHALQIAEVMEDPGFPGR